MWTEVKKRKEKKGNILMDAAEERAPSDVEDKLNWDSMFPLGMKGFATTSPPKRKPMNKAQRDYP